MKNDKIYLACYSTGQYEDFEIHIVFASNVKSRVTKWVSKFNKMHKRWEAHYGQYCDSRYGDILSRWITEEHYDKFNRWDMLRNINRAYCNEIGLR